MKKTYINEELLAKLSQIPLKPFSFAEGLYKGHHRSLQSGEATDFKEFRHYIPGDDLKKVDWKRSARHNDFFVKEYEEELNYKIHLIIDSSSSMSEQSEDSLSKIEYSKHLVMALSYLFLKQGDQVQVITINEITDICFKFNQTLKNLNQLDQSLIEIKAEKKTNLNLLPKNIQSKKSEKAIVFIFSDFVYPLDELFTILTQINSPKNRLILFQLNNNNDLNFPFKGDLEFINPETGEVFFTKAADIRNQYMEKWSEFNHQLGQWCFSKDIDFQRLNCSDHYSDNLLQFIKHYHNKGI